MLENFSQPSTCNSSNPEKRGRVKTLWRKNEDDAKRGPGGSRSHGKNRYKGGWTPKGLFEGVLANVISNR